MMIHNILSSFKWYRKYRGGKWYYVRVICDMGRNVTFYWTNENLYLNEYLLKTETY